MDKFLISVIIATYNRCESLKDTLDSLEKQESDGSFDVEIIVVDNNSKDKTRELINYFIPKFGGKLRYIFEPQQGKPHALNTGIKHSKGEVIAFTDDDNILSNNWLKEISRVFLENKDVLCTCGQIKPYFKEGVKIPKWCNSRLLNRVFGCFSCGSEPRYLNTKEGLPSGMNTFVRKEIFDKIGCFDTAFPRGQDTDFSFRAQNDGIRFFYSPNIINFHKINEKRLNKKYFRYYHYISGRNAFKRESGEDVKKYSRKIPNIPPWIIKNLVLNLIKTLLWKLTANSQVSFEYEANFYQLLGRVSGAMKHVKS